MRWIAALLLYLFPVLGAVHGKPYSIHVSIHYPKGGKKPEVLVSEGPKGKIIKDVKVIQTGAVPDDYDATRPLHNPPRGGAVSAASASRRREDNPRLIYPEDVPFSSPYPSKPKLVVPTETEQYHMKIAAQKYKERRQPHEGQKHKQTVLKLTKKARKVAPPLDLEDSKQDDHRRYWKGAVKKAYTSYKNLPLSRRERRKPVRPVVPSRQTYDLTRIKEYERLRGRGAARRRADAAAEYKEGAVEERLPERYDPDFKPDYEDVRAPNGRGPAVQRAPEAEAPPAVGRDEPGAGEPDEPGPAPHRADDYESFHPFKYQKGEDPTDYKDFDPYVDIKKSIKDGYRDISVVKGCVHVGLMMRNPEDRCGYLECVHAEEQRFERDLVAQRRKCAPGTAVPYSWRGGLDNPCIEAAAYCKNVVEVEDIEEEQYPPGHSGPKLSDAATAASSKETAEAAPALQGEEA